MKIYFEKEQDLIINDFVALPGCISYENTINGYLFKNKKNSCFNVPYGIIKTFIDYPVLRICTLSYSAYQQLQEWAMHDANKFDEYINNQEDE